MGTGPAASEDAEGSAKRALPASGRGSSKRLRLGEAERYMLELINRDRSREGLGRVIWDDRAAAAGRLHAQDMARHGYTGHFGSDGSVPEQRYTDVGGTHYVQENAACVGDAIARGVEQNPIISPEEVEAVERAFMDERPPNDGHRKNILVPWHNHVGIGIARPSGVPLVCLAQEFTDIYGTYAGLPPAGRTGMTVEISGEVRPPAKFGGIGIARIALPSPRTAEQLNQMHTYPIPQPFVSYFPKGFVTPIAVKTEGNHFDLTVPLTEKGQPGLYEVSVWAHVPGTKDLVMVSLRSVALR